MTGRAAHSGLLSGRLEGVLRSRTFTIEKNHVLYHMAGKGAKLNLIVDSLRLIQNPIYGGLTISLDNPDTLKWHVQNVSKWIGHNAYIELIDPGEGFIAVDQILFSPTAAQLGSGTAIAGTGGDLTGGIETAAIVSNFGNVTLTATASGALTDAATDTIAFTQITTTPSTLTSATALPAPTLANGTSNTVTITAPASKVIVQDAKWTYAYANSAVVPSGTYGGINTNNSRVVYTASML